MIWQKWQRAWALAGGQNASGGVLSSGPITWRDIWRERHFRIELDKLEAAQIEAEAAEIRALEAQFEDDPAPAESNEFDSMQEHQVDRQGRKEARVKVPSFQWDQVEADFVRRLQPDNLRQILSRGRKGSI